MQRDLVTRWGPVEANLAASGGVSSFPGGVTDTCTFSPSGAPTPVEVAMNQRSRSVRDDDGVIRRPETKSFILTSEFWVAAGAAAAVFIGGYVLDDIADATAWKYGVWIAIAYIVSRGIAKAGSQRAYQPEPRAMANGYRPDSYRNDTPDGYRDDAGLRETATANEPTRAYDVSERP